MLANGSVSYYDKKYNLIERVDLVVDEDINCQNMLS